MTIDRFKDKLRATSLQQDSTLERRFQQADNILLKGRGVSAVVRDTFSMPPEDYRLIEDLRTRAARGGRNTQKSEVIRTGLQQLTTLSDADLVLALNRLQKVPVGRRR